MAVEYHKLHGPNEIQGSLLFKYKMAKALTLVSLAAIVMMALYSLFNPSLGNSSLAKELQDEAIVESDSQSSKCYLPGHFFMPNTTDGSYTPPPPDSSLLRAVAYASTEEYQDYCKKYDPSTGFTDEWSYNGHGECGSWQKKYEKMHKHDLEMLNGYKKGVFPSSVKYSERPRYISYVCTPILENSNRGCGGLGDRMNGMISTFFYALITDRTYFINWDEHNPLPLELVWERPYINWTHSPAEMEQVFSQKNRLLGYQKVDMLNQKLPILKSFMLPKGGKTDFNQLWNETFVQVRSNRGYIVHTFNSHPDYTKKLNAVGLTKENAFGCITNFLFRPTIGSRRFLNAYKAVFEMESVLSIGIQIRTDDNAMANPQYDFEGVEKWNYFFHCAGELAEYKMESQHKHVIFFLVTDSTHLRNEFTALNNNKEVAKTLFGDIADIATMVTTGLPIEHIEPDQVAKYIDVEVKKKVNIERMLPGSNSAYMENWLLGYTQYRVISPQGYGKMAAFFSTDDKASISMPRPSQNATRPMCNRESAFVTYDWLSTQWSLG